MPLLQLYTDLSEHHGAAADPDIWWPIFYGRTEPPAFERVITNVLVQRADFKIQVPNAIVRFERDGLLTAAALADAPLATIAACARPTGFQQQKAETLKAFGQYVVTRFGTEAAFCSQVTRADLRPGRRTAREAASQGIKGIGEESADRILLYACGRLAWPVDTYCLRVLAHHGLISRVPMKTAERRQVAAAIRQMVEEQLPRQVDAWRRLHALMQLEGVTL